MNKAIPKMKWGINQVFNLLIRKGYSELRLSEKNVIG